MSSQQTGYGLLRLGRQLTGIGRAIGPLAAAAQGIHKDWSALGAILAPEIRAALSALERLPEATKKACLLAGTAGWYIPEQLPVTLIREILDRDEDGVSQLMEGVWRAEFEESARITLERHCARRCILQAAIDAHRRGTYELSVPVFLIQADGLCLESTGLQLYARKKNGTTQAIATHIDGIETFRKYFLESVRVPMPLTASREERQATVIGLNRHAVIHGESLKYASETNSLKAFSLVCCVSAWLSKRKDECQEQ